MEDNIFQLIALYSLYYIVIPGLIVLIVWKIKQQREFIESFSIYNEEQKNESFLDKNNKKLKNLQILLVIFILLSMPALSLISHGVQDTSIHHTRNYMARGYFPAHIDRVDEKIGPTFNTEEAVKQMDEAEYKNWYLDDIRDQIDLDDIFGLPGRVTVYRLKPTRALFEQIVITYDYLSPLPIIRSIVFTVIEEQAFLEADNTIVYPMPPSMAVSS